jgi:hypothetical protein
MRVAVAGDVCMKRLQPPRRLRVRIELVPCSDEFVPSHFARQCQKGQAAGTVGTPRQTPSPAGCRGFVPAGNEIVPDITYFAAFGPLWSNLGALRESCR